MNSLTPIVIGNWKMNPNTLSLAKQLFLDIKKGLGKKDMLTTVAIAPPLPFIGELKRLDTNQRLTLMSQDISEHVSGPHTGLVSLAMVQSIGVGATIIGHSESRARGETEVMITAKIKLAVKAKLPIVVCVGEKTRDERGSFYSFVQDQVKSILSAVPKSQISLLTIAYEPIWAIGTGKYANPDDVLEMKLFIQKVIADTLGRKAIGRIKILYGGSVTTKNASEIIEHCTVDGFLVGGASLRATDFINIVNAVEKYAKATL